MLPDVIASTLLTGTPPPITQAIRLIGHGKQQNLAPVRLRGDTIIDPTTDDPFLAMIELRHQVRNDPARPSEQRDRLQLFLKITANATSYGSLARFDRRRYSKPKTVTVYGPDEPTKTKTKTPEDPGPYTFPPIAASITAGARLMLAMIERAVTDAGGTYALCDTDSMAIITHPHIRTSAAPTPDGTNQIPVLLPDVVRAILDRFEQLNPYNPDIVPRLWTEEHDSLDTPLWCYTISTKRYAMYRIKDTTQERAIADTQTLRTGDYTLVDWSEHGLGMYRDPTGKAESRDDQGRRTWIRDAWHWILTADGDPNQLPAWADRPAITRFSLSSPAVAAWFSGYNRNKPTDEQLRPATFGLLAQPDRFTPDDLRARKNSGWPAAPYETDPTKWLDLAWYDRTGQQIVTITTASPRDDPDEYAHQIASGRQRVRTIADVLATYRTRPEHKSLAPDGQPATGSTRGLLRRRPIESAPVLTDLIGKEGNQLEERATGVTNELGQYRGNYGSRADRFTQLVIPSLPDMGVDEVMRRTGRKKSAAYAVLAGKLKKRRSPAAGYRDVTVEYATEKLQRAGVHAPRHAYGVLYTWLAYRE